LAQAKNSADNSLISEMKAMRREKARNGSTKEEILLGWAVI
jgi:hypothetical protein